MRGVPFLAMIQFIFSDSWTLDRKSILSILYIHLRVLAKNLLATGIEYILEFIWWVFSCLFGCLFLVHFVVKIFYELSARVNW